MNRSRVVADDEARVIAVTAHQLGELIVANASQHGRIGDLVAVEVQYRQYRTIVGRVEELVRVPASGQRTGLGFPVTDYAQHQQIRVVERGSISMYQGIAQLTTLVD